MKQSPEIGKLAAALVQAHKKLAPLAKSATNRFNKKYASLDTILEAVRPVLAEVGLVVVQGATLPTTDEAGRLSSISLETMLVHESGEWLSNTVYFPVGKTVFRDGDRPPEPTGADAAAATSYGRRYGLMALLALGTDEEEATPQASSTRAAQPRRAEKPAAPVATQAPAQRPAPPKAERPTEAVPQKKPADVQVPTKDGIKRLGDIPEEELVKMLEVAKKDPTKWSALSTAIEEVLEEKRNDLPF